jgi:dihydrofolate reductase
MRKIVVTEFVSLDGVFEEPAWTAPYWNDDIANFKAEESFASDALLLGRVTYQAFAAAWPGRTDDEGADQMNNLPKFVVSSTLNTVEWNNSRLLKGNIAEEIARLKQQVGKNILVYGSGKLVHFLLQHDLIDELRLLVYPLVLGSGKRLFPDGSSTKLKLMDTKGFSSGVVGIVYQPVKYGEEPSMS